MYGFLKINTVPSVYFYEDFWGLKRKVDIKHILLPEKKANDIKHILLPEKKVNEFKYINDNGNVLTDLNTSAKPFRPTFITPPKYYSLPYMPSYSSYHSLPPTPTVFSPSVEPIPNTFNSLPSTPQENNVSFFEFGTHNDENCLLETKNNSSRSRKRNNKKN
jgi:hypothetical protein